MKGRKEEEEEEEEEMKEFHKNMLGLSIAAGKVAAGCQASIFHPAEILLPFLCTAPLQYVPQILFTQATIDCFANDKTKNVLLCRDCDIFICLMKS